MESRGKGLDGGILRPFHLLHGRVPKARKMSRVAMRVSFEFMIQKKGQDTHGDAREGTTRRYSKTLPFLTLTISTGQKKKKDQSNYRECLFWGSRYRGKVTLALGSYNYRRKSARFLR